MPVGRDGDVLEHWMQRIRLSETAAGDEDVVSERESLDCSVDS